MLSVRQNFLETIHGGKPDRFVNQFEFMTMGFDPISMVALGNCPKGETAINGWGVTIQFPEHVPGPFPDTSPEKVVIKDIEHWRDYVKAPPTTAPESAWAPFVEMANGIDRNEVFYAPFVAPGIFEKVHYLMGMEEAMMAFYEYPDEMHELIDFLADWEVACAKEVVIHLHPNALLHHDDWGSQKSSFLSPAMFEEFILPAYKKIYGFWKANGVEVIIHHSDSYAANLVPYMIEAGIDIWQGAMTTNDLPKLLDQYGGQITFMGGIDNGKVDKADWSEENCMKWTRYICEEVGPRPYFIPCLVAGGPGSTFPGVYECVTECINTMSKELFPTGQS